MTKIKEFLQRTKKNHPRLWAALKTALAAFVAILFPVVLAWFGQVAEWANNTRPDFPNPDGVLKALVAGAIAALSGLVNFVWNSLMDNKITYDKPE